MFEFAWLWAFAALPLPILFRLLPAKKQQDNTALRVPRLMAQQASFSPRAKGKPWLLIIAALVWICLITAAARPQWLGEAISIPDEGREMILAVDLSGSMKIEDMQVNGIQVNRLQMIKSVLDDFIERRVGDRLGLILFADTAYIQAPLTYDRATVATLLDEAVIGLVGEQTAIGDAVGLAVKRFEQKGESNRVLILLTDGQNTAGNISTDDALELAKNSNVTIYSIGVGADAMMMPSFFGMRKVNPSQELDEGMLTKLAEATGGQYFRARDKQELESIYSTLDKLEPIAGESRKMRPLTALYFYPLMAALLLSLLPALFYLLRQLFSILTNRSEQGVN